MTCWVPNMVCVYIYDINWPQMDNDIVVILLSFFVNVISNMTQTQLRMNWSLNCMKCSLGVVFWSSNQVEVLWMTSGVHNWPHHVLAQHQWTWPLQQLDQYYWDIANLPMDTQPMAKASKRSISGFGGVERSSSGTSMLNKEPRVNWVSRGTMFEHVPTWLVVAITRQIV